MEGSNGFNYQEGKGSNQRALPECSYRADDAPEVETASLLLRGGKTCNAAVGCDARECAQE